MIEDDQLMTEINALADGAEANPGTVDISVLAVSLWANFDDHSLEEIEETLREQWQARGLPWEQSVTR